MPIPVVIMVDVDRPFALSEMVELLEDLETVYSACIQAVVPDPRQATQIQTYVTEIRTGSVWIELITHPDSAGATAVAATFVAVVSGAPWLATLPHTVRERWYRSAARAEEARQAYERIRRKGNFSAAQASMTEVHDRNRTRRRQGQRRSTGTVDTP